MLVSTVMELQPVHGVQGVVDLGRRPGAAGRVRRRRSLAERAVPAPARWPARVLDGDEVPGVADVRGARSRARRRSACPSPRGSHGSRCPDGVRVRRSSSPSRTGSTSGSCSNTSSAAPPITPSWSARASAASSTTGPRLVLTSDCLRLHASEHRRVDKVARLGGQGHVDADDVAGRDELVERDLSGLPARGRGAAVDGLHAQCGGQPDAAVPMRPSPTHRIAGPPVNGPA